MKIVFIHIYKNAGTNIAAALLPFAANQWQLKAEYIFNIVCGNLQ